MTLNGYFMSNAVFVPAVLLRAFKAHHKKRMKIDAHSGDKNEA